MTMQDFRVAAHRDEPLEATLQFAVTKALTIIWDSRFDFTLHAKQGIGDRKEDFCSSVDHKAQAVVVDCLRMRQFLREYGFLCEEDGVAAWNGTGPYFTIDALDGTLPFKHGNLHAVSSMVAAVREDGKIEAACIGDVTTGDLISYGPTSVGVNYTSGQFFRELPRGPISRTTLAESALLLRRPVGKYSPVIQQLVEETADHFITNESLGVWMPRLWKREVPMAVLCAGAKVTPWDITPLIGISQKLGYVFLRSTQDGKRLARFTPKPPIRPSVRTRDVLIIHAEDLYLVRHLLAP